VPAMGAGVSTAVIILLLSLTLPPWSDIVRSQPSSVDDKLETYALERTDFLERLSQQHRDDPQLRTYRFVTRCSTRQDSIIAWPYMPNAYYFTDRLFGTRQMGVWPGSYDTVEKQEEIIQELIDTPPLFLIYRPFRFNDDVRTMEDFAPVLYAFLMEHYVPIRTFGPFTVYIHRDRQPYDGCAFSTE